MPFPSASVEISNGSKKPGRLLSVGRRLPRSCSSRSSTQSRPRRSRPAHRSSRYRGHLGIYGLFTVGRLALAYQGRLSRGFVAISVVVEILVLMITIWSFHLQYQAPPALYLKAPTLMYVFILIALRTLRFEPGYVLLAGGCAAWAGSHCSFMRCGDRTARCSRTATSNMSRRTKSWAARRSTRSCQFLW